MKKIWYEIDQEKFSGLQTNMPGSFQGIIKSIKYLKEIKIDNLIIQDFLKNYNLQNINSINEYHKNHGTIDDLNFMIEELKKEDIETFLKFDLSQIKSIHKKYKNMISYLNNEITVKTNENNEVDFLHNTNDITDESNYTQSYFIKTKTLDFEGNWSSDHAIQKLLEIMKYISNLGFKGIIFHDFEYLYGKENEKPLNQKTIYQLQNIFEQIKTRIPNFTIVWESELVNWFFIEKNKIQHNKLFDFLIDNSFASLNKINKSNFDLFTKMDYKKFNNYLKSALNNKNVIFNIQPTSIGRINSIWGNTNSMIEFSDVSLILLALLNNKNVKFYSGQELGYRNLEKEFINEIHDVEINEKRHMLENEGVNSQEFNFSFSQLNSLNLHYPFIWKIDQNKIKYLSNQQHYSYQSQKSKQYSTFNFFKKMITLVKNNTWIELLKDAKYEVKRHRNFLINISIKTNYFTIKLVSQLENSFSNIRINKRAKILLSSYRNKKYHELPKQINPYESLVVVYGKNNNSETKYLIDLFKSTLKEQNE